MKSATSSTVSPFCLSSVMFRNVWLVRTPTMTDVESPSVSNRASRSVSRADGVIWKAPETAGSNWCPWSAVTTITQFPWPTSLFSVPMNSLSPASCQCSASCISGLLTLHRCPTWSMILELM